MPSPAIVTCLPKSFTTSSIGGGVIDYDAVFLDVNMPTYDGIDIGTKIRHYSSRTEIIYISGQENRVFDCFSVRPYGFLRKSRFLEDIEPLIKRFINDQISRHSGQGNIVAFRSKTSIVNIRGDEIKYIESVKDYQYIHITESKEPVKIRSSLEKIFEQLGDSDFIRCHKAFLVNCKFIRRIDYDNITLITGETVPVGRTKIAEVREKYILYNRKKGMFKI